MSSSTLRIVIVLILGAASGVISVTAKIIYGCEFSPLMHGLELSLILSAGIILTYNIKRKNND